MKNSILKNGTFWHIALWAIGIGALAVAGYTNLTNRTDTLDKECNQLAIEAKQNAAIDNETKQDVRELKTGIQYIREDVAEIKDDGKTIKQSLDDLKKEIRQIPYW